MPDQLNLTMAAPQLDLNLKYISDLIDILASVIELHG